FGYHQPLDSLGGGHRAFGFLSLDFRPPFVATFSFLTPDFIRPLDAPPRWRIQTSPPLPVRCQNGGHGVRGLPVRNRRNFGKVDFRHTNSFIWTTLYLSPPDNFNTLLPIPPGVSGFRTRIIQGMKCQIIPCPCPSC